MPMSDPFLPAVLRHTPLWVWPLLAVLFALGVRQAFPRRVALGRATLLPASMLVLSLWGVVSVFGSGLALTAWVAGGIASAAWSLHRGAPRGACWSSADQVFRLPGSWVPLLLILGLFCTKFGVAMKLALHPELHDSIAFVASAGLTYGAFSGLFAGRGLALWRLAQPGPQPRPA